MSQVNINFVPVSMTMSTATASWPNLFPHGRCFSQPAKENKFIPPGPYLAVMRVVGEIPHSDCKITIFHWNNRYLIKLEQGPFEQTFKIQEYDLTSEEEVRRVVTEQFIQSALKRFEAMAQSLGDALTKI